MICQNCGMEITDGAQVCSSCGAPVETPVVTPSYQPANKTSPAKLIAIIVAVVALAGITIFTKVRENALNGTYELIEMTYKGETITEEQIKSSNAHADFKINGKQCSLEGEKATIKIKGDKIEVTDSVGTYDGTYDKSEKTITLDINGIIMKFRKK